MNIYDELWDFQKKDVRKLLPERKRLIGSEMGSGKTFEAVALDDLIRQDTNHGATLIIGPWDVLDQWSSYYERFCPDMAVFKVDRKDRNGSWERFAKSGKKDKVFLVHWQALRLMPQLEKQQWLHIIGDEVHALQNRKAKQTLALKRCRATFKTGLSGTPITSSPVGYWSILNWLDPTAWRSYWRYYQRYVDYDIIYPQGYHKVVGPKNEAELLELVDPFYVRHLKKKQCCPDHPNGVMPWIPDKYYTTEWVELSSEQRRVYEEMRKEKVAWVGAHRDEPLVAAMAISMMTRLQQFSGAYATIGERVELSEPSSKIDRLVEILEANPTEPVVVFSQYEQMIRLVKARLDREGITCGVFTGKNRNDRDLVKEAFIDGKIQVFAGTISAGGVGLDGLQGPCSTVVFLDRLWSPALNLQAEDRLWRGGQVRAVQVIDIIARNTVDLGRRQRLEMKWSWIERLLGDTVLLQKAETAA